MYTHTLASSHTQNTCDEALFFLYFCLVYVRLGIKETGIKKKKKKRSEHGPEGNIKVDLSVWISRSLSYVGKTSFASHSESNTGIYFIHER